MYIICIIFIFLVIILISKKTKLIETGYWGPWGYSEKYDWVYPDGYKAYIPNRNLYYNLNNSIYLPYEYWL